MPLPPDQLHDDEYDRLARYVSGEEDAAERALTARWIADDAARGEALRELEEAWGVSRSSAVVDVDSAWGALAGRIRAPGPVERNDPKVIPFAPARPWWRKTGAVTRIAAAAVLVVGVAALWPVVRGRTTGSGISEIAAGGAHFETKPGERRTIPLPDGTEVVLGAASTLTVAEGYRATGSGPREVTLRGEGFFRVTHDERRPFRVSAGATVVEDLGTEFAVRAYTGDMEVRVAVASGSVAVRRGTTQQPDAVLAPSDVAIVRDTGNITLARGVDVSRYTAFTDGRLVFTDTPLADVARDLTRWYGIEVRVTDEALLDRHLTAAFEAESLDEVLRVIGMTLDVRYQRGDRSVDFTGPGGGAPAAGERGRTGEAGGAEGSAKGFRRELTAPARVEAGV